MCNEECDTEHVKYLMQFYSTSSEWADTQLLSRIAYDYLQVSNLGRSNLQLHVSRGGRQERSQRVRRPHLLNT